MTVCEQKLSDLLAALDSLLKEGVLYSEYALIQELQKSPFSIFDSDAMRDNLTLFQTHFLLYHALYLLQGKYQQETFGYLKISALEVQLQFDSTDHPLHEGDIKLRDYYLDLSHFSQTTEQDVANLIEDFWRRVGRKESQSISELDINTALEFFELAPAAEWSEIKNCFKKYMLQQHPDRGGSLENAQQAQRHFAVLRCVFSK